MYPCYPVEGGSRLLRNVGAYQTNAMTHFLHERKLKFYCCNEVLCSYRALS